MKISNVLDIYDNGEFISITTLSHSTIHLPTGKHSVTILDPKQPTEDNYIFDVSVDLNEI